MKAVIAGAGGFLGTHARYFLHEKERAGEAVVVPLDRAAFQDSSTLDAAVAGSDVIFHCAGINRASDQELEAGNQALAATLIESCERVGAKPHILFASSIHETKDSAYGRGKKGAADALLAFGERSGARITVFTFPHLFGEFAKPDYNSAVATFCRDLAEGKESTVNPEGRVELLYVQEALAAMGKAYEDGTTGRINVPGTPMSIAEVYALLSSFNATYRTGAFPALRSRLELSLFNTLHSYLFDVLFPLTLKPNSDERGTLFEIVRSGRTDQVFFSTTKPGAVRGEHYHTHKMERFCVIDGEGEIAVRRLLTDEVRRFKVSGDTPVAIDMPTFCTHNLRNVGAQDLRTVFWISEQYDPSDPDTFREPV